MPIGGDVEHWTTARSSSKRDQRREESLVEPEGGWERGMPRVSHLVKGTLKCRSHKKPSSSVAWLNGLLVYWGNTGRKRKPITDQENA